MRVLWPDVIENYTYLGQGSLMDQVQGLMRQMEALLRSDDWAAAPPFELDEFEAREEEARKQEAEQGLYVEDSHEATLISFAFLGSKGATMDNRKVHAVPGKVPQYDFEFWHTPALCGIEPKFLKHYGWIGDCSILRLSCVRCEKKLRTLPHVIRLPDYMGGGFSRRDAGDRYV